jgi:hypothetical protein
MLVRTLLLAATLVLPSAVRAQGQALPKHPTVHSSAQQEKQNIPQSTPAVSAGAEEFKALGVIHLRAIKEIDSQENADMDAAKMDRKLTLAQKAQKLAFIRKDYNSHRWQIERKYAQDRKKLHDELRKKRPAIHRVATSVQQTPRPANSKR